jgi:hypothetical protein
MGHDAVQDESLVQGTHVHDLDYEGILKILIPAFLLVPF